MKIKGGKHYWALICDDSNFGAPYNPLICGVFASKKEAKEVAKKIEDCMCKHVIKRCAIEIEI